MDLYAVYEVAEGYDGYDSVMAIFFQEPNARKELEACKKRLESMFLADSRYKQWWAEEPLDPYQPNTIVRWRLFDSARTSENHVTEYLLEIRVLQTGDENAERREQDQKAKTPAPKKSKASQKD